MLEVVHKTFSVLYLLCVLIGALGFVRAKTDNERELAIGRGAAFLLALITVGCAWEGCLTPLTSASGNEVLTEASCIR